MLRFNRAVFIRTVSLVMAQLMFIPANLIFCAQNDVDRISIPETHGKIVEKYKGGPDKPLVIHIRDAHCNIDAQQNISEIIQSLVNDYGVQLVGLEGALGDIDVSNFRSFPIKEVRRDVSSAFLSTGNISGAEYALINTDKPFVLKGIDTPDLYKAAHSAFLDSVSQLNEVTALLSNLANQLDILNRAIAGDELSGYFNQRYSYLCGKQNLTAYCQYLLGLMVKHSIPADGYKSLSNLDSSLKMEKSFDLAKVTSESDQIFESIQSFLEGEEKEKLVQAKLKYHLGSMTNKDYYSLLDTSMRSIDMAPEDYPAFSNYIKYLTVASQIDTAELIKELNAVSELIEGKIVITDNQRKLNKLLYNFAVLEEAVKLKIPRQDYIYLKNHKDEFTSKYFYEGMSSLSGIAKAKINIPENMSLIDNTIRNCAAFYDSSVKRDIALADNLISKMSESGISGSIAVAGGFHTDGMAEYLKSKGYSYLIINPGITKQDGSGNYVNLMARGKNALITSLTANSALAVESVLEKHGILFSDAELSAYRNAFNSYLLAYAANHIKDAEFLKSNIKIIEDSITADALKKLKPVLDNIQTALGESVKDWVEQNFKELKDFKIEKAANDNIRVSLNINDKLYTFDVAKKDLAKGTAMADTALNLAPGLNMALASISEIVAMPDNLKNVDTSVKNASEIISNMVAPPLENRHKRITANQLLDMLSTSPDIMANAKKLLDLNSISQIWIEENTPVAVITAFIYAMSQPESSSDRLALSKEISILEDFSYGLMVTSDLSGANQLNLYSVPKLIAKKYARTAELETEKTDARVFNDSLAGYFQNIPDGKNGISISESTLSTLLPSEIFGELSSSQPGKLRQAVADEIRQSLIFNDSTAITEKYQYVSDKRPQIAPVTARLFAQNTTDILMERESLSQNDYKRFVFFVTGILNAYGLEFAKPVFDFFDGKPSDFTNKALNSKLIKIDVLEIPLAFVSPEVGLSEKILNDILNKGVSTDEFYTLISSLLYNSWISKEDRDALIQKALAYLNNRLETITKSKKFLNKQDLNERANLNEYIKGIYRLLAFANNKEQDSEAGFKKGESRFFQPGDKPLQGLSASNNKTILDFLESNSSALKKRSTINTMVVSKDTRFIDVLSQYIERNPQSDIIQFAMENFLKMIEENFPKNPIERKKYFNYLFLSMQVYAKSHYFDLKRVTLKGFYKIMESSNIPLSIKIPVLSFMESAQFGPDVVMRGYASAMLRDINPSDLMSTFQSGLNSGIMKNELPSVLAELARIRHLVLSGINEVDKLSFNTAVDLFLSTSKHNIFVELASEPTIDDLKRLSKLSFEVGISRDRNTHKWYAVKGKPTQVASEMMFGVLFKTGNFDISIHNHPEEDMAIPSPADINTAQKTDKSYIVAEDGITEHTQTTINFATGKFGVTPLNILEAEEDKWIKVNKISLDQLHELRKSNFGVTTAFIEWNSVNTKDMFQQQSKLGSLLLSQAPETQLAALTALSNYSYPDFVKSLALIDYVDKNLLNSPQDSIKDAANNVMLRFFKEMDLFKAKSNLSYTIMKQLFDANEDFIKKVIGVTPQFAQQSKWILNNITEIRQVMNNISVELSMDMVDFWAPSLNLQKEGNLLILDSLANIQTAVNGIISQLTPVEKNNKERLIQFNNGITSIIDQLHSIQDVINVPEINTELTISNTNLMKYDGGSVDIIEPSPITLASSGYKGIVTQIDVNSEFITKEITSTGLNPQSKERIINDITQMFTADAQINNDIFDKYKKVYDDNPKTIPVLAGLISEALAIVLSGKNILTEENMPVFNIRTSFLIEKYGMDFIKPLYIYMMDKTPENLRAEFLFGEDIRIDNNLIPISLVSKSPVIAGSVIENISLKSADVNEFTSNISYLLYNPSISPQMRAYMIQIALDSIKKSGKQDFMSALYNIISENNSREFQLPSEIKKAAFSDKMRKYAIKAKYLLLKKSKLDELSAVLKSDKPLEEKEIALALLGQSKEQRSLFLIHDYVINNISADLAPLGYEILFNKLSGMLAENDIAVTEAERIFNDLMKSYRTNRFLKPKVTFLEQLGLIVSNQSIPWEIRGRALFELEKAQFGPDISVLSNATAIFNNVKGYDMLSEIKKNIDNGEFPKLVQSMMSVIGSGFELAESKLVDVDKLNLETAIEIYKNSPKQGVLFELTAPPSLNQYKMLSNLSFEVLIIRDRMSGIFYIVNGNEDSINSTVMAYLSQAGRIDFAIHNHPNRNLPIPSTIDFIVGAKDVENNYVIAKEGIAKFGVITKHPFMNIPIRVTNTSDFTDMYDDWLNRERDALSLPPDEHDMRMFKAFGINYDFSSWDNIDINKMYSEKNSITSLLKSKDQFLRAIAYDAILHSGYPSLISELDVINEAMIVADEINITGIENLAKQVEPHYKSKLNNFIVMFNYTSSILKEEAGIYKDYFQRVIDSDSTFKPDVDLAVKAVTGLIKVLSDLKFLEIKELKEIRENIAYLENFILNVNRKTAEIVRTIDIIIAKNPDMMSKEPYLYKSLNQFRIESLNAYREYLTFYSMLTGKPITSAVPAYPKTESGSFLSQMEISSIEYKKVGELLRQRGEPDINRTLKRYENDPKVDITRSFFMDFVTRSKESRSLIRFHNEWHINEILDFFDKVLPKMPFKNTDKASQIARIAIFTHDTGYYKDSLTDLSIGHEDRSKTITAGFVNNIKDNYGFEILNDIELKAVQFIIERTKLTTGDDFKRDIDEDKRAYAILKSLNDGVTNITATDIEFLEKYLSGNFLEMKAASLSAADISFIMDSILISQTMIIGDVFGHYGYRNYTSALVNSEYDHDKNIETKPTWFEEIAKSYSVWLKIEHDRLDYILYDKTPLISFTPVLQNLWKNRQENMDELNQISMAVNELKNGKNTESSIRILVKFALKGRDIGILNDYDVAKLYGEILGFAGPKFHPVVESVFINLVNANAAKLKPEPEKRAPEKFQSYLNETVRFFNLFNSNVPTSLPFGEKLSRAVNIFFETGLINGVKDKSVNPFDILNSLNFTDEEKILISSFAGIKDVSAFNDKLAMPNIPQGIAVPLQVLLNIITDGKVPYAQVNSSVTGWQSFINPDIKVSGKNVFGELSKNGTNDIAGIIQQSNINAKDIEITVNGNKIFLKVEADIIKSLGFDGTNALIDFAVFIEKAIKLRGEHLYFGLSEGETISIGIVDTSKTLFADDANNGFIGINKAFFNFIDKQYLRQVFMVGITHELRHEAGVYIAGNLIEEEGVVESTLTAEDVSFTKLAVNDLEGYMASLGKVLRTNVPETPDYLSRLNVSLDKNAIDNEPTIPDAAVIAEIMKAQRETGGSQFYTIFKNGSATGKTGEAIGKSLSEIKSKSNEYPLLGMVYSLLNDKIPVLSIPSPDGSIGLYRDGNRIRLGQVGFDNQLGAVNALYLGKTILEKLILNGIGLDEFLVYEGIKALAFDIVFDAARKNQTANELSAKLEEIGLKSFASAISKQSDVSGIRSALSIKEFIFGSKDKSPNDVFRISVLDALNEDALEYQKVFIKPSGGSFQSLKSNLIKDNKAEAVTYVLDQIAKSDVSKKFLYTQFKNMELAQQQLIIDEVSSLLGNNFENNILNTAKQSDEVTVSTPQSTRLAVTGAVESNLPIVFIIPKEFFAVTVSQRNWNMEFFINQFKEQQKKLGNFIVFISADTDSKDPFGLMVQMKIKGVDGTDVDYIQRASNTKELMDSLKARFPESPLRIMDLPGGKMTKEAVEYSKFNNLNFEVIPVEEEQFFYDAVLGSMFISGVKASIELPKEETELTELVSQFYDESIKNYLLSDSKAVPIGDIINLSQSVMREKINGFIEKYSSKIEGMELKLTGSQIKQAQMKLSGDDFVKEVKRVKADAVRQVLLSQFQLAKLNRVYSYFNLNDIEQILSLYKKVLSVYDLRLKSDGQVAAAVFQSDLSGIQMETTLRDMIYGLDLGKGFKQGLKSVFLSYLTNYSQDNFAPNYQVIAQSYIKTRFDSIDKQIDLTDNGNLVPIGALNVFLRSAEGTLFETGESAYFSRLGSDMFNKAKIIRSATETITEKIQQARSIEQSA